MIEMHWQNRCTTAAVVVVFGGGGQNQVSIDYSIYHSGATAVFIPTTSDINAAIVVNNINVWQRGLRFVMRLIFFLLLFMMRHGCCLLLLLLLENEIKRIT